MTDREHLIRRLRVMMVDCEDRWNQDTLREAIETLEGSQDA
jgi:hypothetical protein